VEIVTRAFENAVGWTNRNFIRNATNFRLFSYTLTLANEHADFFSR